jgi:hypothetical protein
MKYDDKRAIIRFMNDLLDADRAGGCEVKWDDHLLYLIEASDLTSNKLAEFDSNEDLMMFIMLWR